MVWSQPRSSLISASMREGQACLAVLLSSLERAVSAPQKHLLPQESDLPLQSSPKTRDADPMPVTDQSRCCSSRNQIQVTLARTAALALIDMMPVCTSNIHSSRKLFRLGYTRLLA